MDASNTPKYYVIDHQEGPLGDWAKSEFIQMFSYLSKSKSHVVITNGDTMIYTGKDEKEKKFHDDNLEELKKELAKWENRHLLIGKPIKDLISDDRKSFELDGKTFSFNRVVLLDLRADGPLTPGDAKDFDVMVFGGILGDHPPRDRTKELRDQGFIRRHLREIQMSTDTALLSTKLITENQIPIDQIPYLDEPEFSKKDGDKIQETVVMEGFRYVSNEIDPHTGVITKKENPFPQGSPKIYNDLIFEDFDFTL